MNDEFLRKLAISTGAFNKMKSITDLAGAFAPLSTVDLAVQRSLSSLSFQNPALDAITKSSLAINTQYFEPSKFNPVMSAFGSVTQMMHQMQFQQPVYNPVNLTMIDLMRDFSKYHLEAVSPLLGISQITSKLLSDIKFDTFNWRETYPDLFTEEYQIEDSSEYSKFNKNLDKLMDLSIIDENSTLSDGIAVSVNLDTNTDVTALDPVIEKILSITNQAIEIIISDSTSAEANLNRLVSKLKKFTKNQYTAGIAISLIFMVAGYYFNKRMDKLEKSNENIVNIVTMISENQINIKQKPIKTYKYFAIAQTGTKILILEKNRVWSKIAFDNQNGISQIGYCLTSELKESN